jgi:hypothetical protein
MRLLDLFCGRWGWSRAFAARGWECVGVDIAAPEDIPDRCFFRQDDVCELPMSFIKEGGFTFIVASPPCQEFAVHGMKHFHPNPPYPEIGIHLFNQTRAMCEASGIPYVMENVRAAEQFVGRAVFACGPFALWGTGVPILFPKGITKAITVAAQGDLRGAERKLPAAEKRRIRLERGGDLYRMSSKQRAALSAKILPELANCVCDHAEWLLEQRKSA